MRPSTRIRAWSGANRLPDWLGVIFLPRANTPRACACTTWNGNRVPGPGSEPMEIVSAPPKPMLLRAVVRERAPRLTETFGPDTNQDTP